jgi:hypothetical protein
MRLNTENTTCRNCQTEMPEDSLYCPKCSQKNTDGRIPILSFVLDLLENIFSLDSKLLKTSWGLFIPGKLTNEFFQGKLKSFATPSRLFLASALLFFAMLSVQVQQIIQDKDITGDVFGINEKNRSKEIQLAEINKAREELGNSMIDNTIRATLDSAEIKIKQSDVDTNLVDISLWSGSYKFIAADLMNLTADSMIQKYEIKGFVDQMVFRQAYKLTKEPKSLIYKLIGNLTWMMLLVIPSMALIFKLLYIRRKKYYVEHLVFLFHIHAFFLFVGVVFLIYKQIEPGPMLEYETLGLISVFYFYSLIALKSVYEQGWIKTFFKSILVLFFYFIVLFFCMIIISVVSFILF